MEAAQITMLSTTSAPAMIAGANPVADSTATATDNSFGSMLGQSMKGAQEAGTQAPAVQGAGTATQAVKQDAAQDAESSGSDSLVAETDSAIVSQMAAMYAQLALLQPGVQVQQSGQMGQPVEVAAASDVSVSGMGQIETTTGNQMIQLADAEPKAQELAPLKGTDFISPKVLTSSTTALKVGSAVNQAVSSDTAVNVVSAANQSVSSDTAVNMVTAANQSVSSDTAVNVVTAANQSVSSDTAVNVVTAANRAVSGDMPKEAAIPPAATAAVLVSATTQATANDLSIEAALIKPYVQSSTAQAVSPASVTNQAVSRDVPKDVGLSATAAATTTEPLANQTVTSKSQANALKTSLTGQPAEILNQPDSYKLEKDSNLQEVLATTKAQSPTASGTKNAAEAQIVPQELSASTKNSTAASPQPVRFAQPADVMVATADSGSQENLSSDSGGKGSQSLLKIVKSVTVPAETLLSVFANEQAPISSAVEHQLLNPQTGHQDIIAVDAMASEPTGAVTTEQVGRQVLERLASHEVKQGNDQITLKLSPENLGNLQVNLRMDNQRLNLEIVAENRSVRDALLQQKDELKETFARQNIQMDSFTVTTGSNGNSSQQSRDWRQMAAEQQLSRYASARSSNSAGSFETPMQYFVPQYQSTLDVRF